MLLTVLTALVVLAADLLTKHLAETMLTEQLTVAIPGLLSLKLSHNSGIALGLMQGNKWAMLVLPVVMLLVCWHMLRKYQPTHFVRFAGGLILGGFAGNYVQRITLGYVVDMIYLPFMPWFVCNIADVAVCFGVGMLVISLLLRPQDWREKNAED